MLICKRLEMVLVDIPTLLILVSFEDRDCMSQNKNTLANYGVLNGVLLTREMLVLMQTSDRFSL